MLIHQLSLPYCAISSSFLWHAPLGVRSAKCRH